MKIFKQETGKSCGIACLRSILNHYGKNFSEEDLLKEHNLFRLEKGGVLNPIMSIGVTALKLGFDVTYYGYNPIITNNNTSKNLEVSLKEKSKNYFDYGKFYIDKALEFLKLKGKLKIDRLSTEKIKKIVDEHKFALVEIRSSFIYKQGKIGGTHKVIVVGYTKKGFKILDPSDAKEHIWDFDTFLLAFYAATPELLVIKDKK